MPNKGQTVDQVFSLPIFFKFVFLLGGIFFAHFSSGSALKKELSFVQSKALEGDNYYQGALALFYKYGEKGLPVDLGESERWAKLAAKQDGGIAMAVLASIELERNKVERGQFLYDEAYLHSNLRELAKAKDPIALFCVGLMEIDNPPRNITKGMRHLERAADQGLATAQATLGMIYFTGIGVSRDPKEAVKWCSKSARQRLPLGMFYLGMAYSSGDGIARNNDFANRWIRAAADQGLVMAQLTLGMKLSLGDGIERNLDHGVQWLRQAANSGSSEAALQLRRFENLLVKTPHRDSSIPNKEKRSVSSLALESTVPSVNNNREYSKSSPKIPMPRKVFAEPTSDPVQMAVEMLAFHNNEEIAQKMLNEIGGQGRADALRELGLLHYKRQEFDQARENFLKAALDKDAQAIRYVGIMHFLGQGTKQDYVKAEKWLSQSLILGDNESNRYLRIAKQFNK
jgi:TPR repeat protein